MINISWFYGSNQFLACFCQWSFLMSQVAVHCGKFNANDQIARMISSKVMMQFDEYSLDYVRSFWYNLKKACPEKDFYMETKWKTK